MKPVRYLFSALAFLMVVPGTAWSELAWSQPSSLIDVSQKELQITGSVQSDMGAYERLSSRKIRQPLYQSDNSPGKWQKKWPKEWKRNTIRMKITRGTNLPVRLSVYNELTGVSFLPGGVMMLNTLSTYYLPSMYGHERVRITLPDRILLSSWDVRALERELERLGIKVKPKPAPPKPTVVLSG